LIPGPAKGRVDFRLPAYRYSVSPAGSGHREPRVSTTTGLIVSIAGTALAGALILIVLLYPVFRPTTSTGAQPTGSSTPGPTPATSGVIVTPSSSVVQIVTIPTAITVTLAGGDSGLPEWSPILVAVIGVLGAIASAFLGYFLQRGRSESQQEPRGSSTPAGAG
jgi:hypothetical protein